MDEAIVILQTEIEALQALRNGRGPQEGTTEWWLLRGKSIGLSMLRAMKVAGCTTPVAAEAYRKTLRKELQD